MKSQEEWHFELTIAEIQQLIAVNVNAQFRNARVIPTDIKFNVEEGSFTGATIDILRDGTPPPADQNFR